LQLDTDVANSITKQAPECDAKAMVVYLRPILNGCCRMDDASIYDSAVPPSARRTPRVSKGEAAVWSVEKKPT